MPYIKQLDRMKFSAALNALEEQVNNAGDFNYLITMIMKMYIEEKGECYQNYNDLIGALECAKIELSRRKIAPYEDKKIDENGDV